MPELGSASAKPLVVLLVLLVVVGLVLVKVVFATIKGANKLMRQPLVKVVVAVVYPPMSRLLGRSGSFWGLAVAHWHAWRLRRSGGYLDIDDPRWSRTPEETAKGTLFYVVGCWAKPPWERHWRCYAYKFGITTNKPARMNQLNTATFTKNVVVTTLPLGEDFEQLMLASTIRWRTDGMGEELRWAVPEIEHLVDQLKQWGSAARTKGYVEELSVR